MLLSATGSGSSRSIYTAGELFNTMDHVVKGNIRFGARIRPIPAVCSIFVIGHCSLRMNEHEAHLY